MKKVCLIFILILSLLPVSADDDDEKLKLAVMEFEDLSGKLSKKMLSIATEQIRSKFVASNKFIVIAKERQENAMIKQMKKESYKLCNDKNCQIPLGQALSADTILRTTITFFGGTYTITSELIDLAKEATTKGAKATFDGSEKSLDTALDSIANQILEKTNHNIIQNSADQRACEYAKNQESLETWKLYLKKFPDGECAFEAESKIVELERKSKKNESAPVQAERKSLQWSGKASKTMKWNDAVNYCKNLNEGGYTDWRLPNIDELRTLIKNHPGTQIGGSCPISEKKGKLAWRDRISDCDIRNGNNFSKLGDFSWFWSSSTISDYIDFAWGVDFGHGYIYDGSKSLGYNVRCVR